MYYRDIPQEVLNTYLSRLSHQSPDFIYFLHQYILRSALSRCSGEEDTNVWNRLNGEELEVAKDIIIDELKVVQDESYIRAVRYFRDSRAIPVLKGIIDSTDSIEIKLIAAKVLYDWVGYDNYFSLLKEACIDTNKTIHSYMHVSIGEFIRGLSETDKDFFINLVK